jgi:hypothetical protein
MTYLASQTWESICKLTEALLAVFDIWLTALLMRLLAVYRTIHVLCPASSFMATVFVPAEGGGRNCF